MFSFHLIGPAQELERGIKLLEDDPDLNRSGTGRPVEAAKRSEPGFSLRVLPDKVRVEYCEKADFFRALSFLPNRTEETGYTRSETPCFKKTGVMVDCSRNAVPKVGSLKELLRKMALMGLNLGMLYTEDTYEIKGRPYFGYMRGRYTFGELKELDDYADALGIELIPCIQTLAHLERALQWPSMDYLRDSERNLMVGEESTYRFIEEMITSASAPFRSNRIHIGMDEAWELGLGRYLVKNGYRPCGELMAEHLKRVSEILRRHGLHAMMWSDMHFLAASPTRALYDENCALTRSVLEGAPADIDLVYWDYYHETEAHYEKLLRLHQQFAAKTIFAGGIWTWIGPATDYRKTLAATLPALEQCREAGIDEVIATAWGDDGAEADLQSILYGLQVYAEYRYTGCYREDAVRARFADCCGADDRPFLDLSLFNELPGFRPMDQDTVTPAKTLLFEDPLMPLFEEDFRGLPCEAHYRFLAEKYKGYAEAQPRFRALFEFYERLAGAIAQKCIWRDRAAACARGGDPAQADGMLPLADRCAEAVRVLKDAWAGLWYSHSKPYGFEVIDLRLSGLIGRFQTAKIRFAEFADGTIPGIPELEEAKLPYLKHEDGTYGCMNSWGSIATVSRIVE